MRVAIRMWLACASVSAMLSARAEAEPGPDGIPTDEQKKATAAYVLSLQRDSGGFAEAKKADQSATVPAAFAAVYALKYFGKPKDQQACEKFVYSCQKLGEKYADTKEGDVRGLFSPTPDGKPDLQTTALAAMIFIELKPEGLAALSSGLKAFRLLDDAKTLQDYRLLGELLQTASMVGIRFNLFDKPAELVKQIKGSANPDGTFGKGEAAVRDTAAAVVAVRGLRGEIDKAEQVVKLLRDAQQPDGGWGKDKSDLDTTWRVVHALAMIKGECDVAACRKFVAKCRNEDGSYSPQPGQSGNVHATYYAGAVLERLVGLAARGK